MSFSMNKLRSFLPGNNNSIKSSNRFNTIESASIEPEVGFQIVIESSTNNKNDTTNKDNNKIPQLNVNLIGARHLPSKFGFKSVQGYIVKVKMFPGSLKFDSSIQTNSWPTFNENFKFPLEPEKKSSFKGTTEVSQNALDKIFAGHFVVFTIYALLELPMGNFNRFKGTYRSLKDRGASLIQKVSDTNTEEQGTASASAPSKQNKEGKGSAQLTKSETKRNLGSVTCYLEPKIFKLNSRTNQYCTDEIWLPIKDFTITPATKDNENNLSASTKGQLELILELSYENCENNENNGNEKTKKQWSLAEMKNKLKSSKSQKAQNDLVFKIITSKFRCSIKTKDEYESASNLVYVKTTVLQNDLVLNSWKCENFVPSLSMRWDQSNSLITIPINKNDITISDLTVKSTIAYKTKVGKKIVLGTIIIGSNSANKKSKEHWTAIVNATNQPTTMWHSFN